MIVYKVCDVIHGQNYSCCRNSNIINMTCGKIRYEIGQTSFPPITGSKLFAFDSLKNARNFIANEMYVHNLCVLKCIATEITKPKWQRTPGILSDIQKFWCLRLRKKKFTHIQNGNLIPVGTVLCNTITPIELVYTY